MTLWKQSSSGVHLEFIQSSSKVNLKFMSSVGVINTSSLLYLDLIQSLSRNCENIIWITTRQYHITKTLSWFYLNFIQNSSCFLFWISNKHKNSILTKLLTQYTSQLQNIVRWCKLQIQYFISLYILRCPA